jgi:hypothetical protein
MKEIITDVLAAAAAAARRNNLYKYYYNKDLLRQCSLATVTVQRSRALVQYVLCITTR